MGRQCERAVTQEIDAYDMWILLSRNEVGVFPRNPRTLGTNFITQP